MRTVATILAALALPAVVHCANPLTSVAQETIIIEDDTAVTMPEAPDECACRSSQAPPWHGSVAGDPCGPCCPPPNVFHANPCGQLHMKHAAHLHGHVRPSCFPRMHTRCTEGWWPTPRPIALPRCPRCGAHIDGGW